MTLEGMHASTEYDLPDQAVNMSFTSNVLPTFVDKVRNYSRAKVLDVGPVCNENINILARLINRFYVCDMYAFMAREKKEKNKSNPWHHRLDYPSGIFDGILLWDLPDRLPNGSAREAGRRCYELLKPGGMVLARAAAETEKNTGVNAFVLQEGFRLSFRHQPHLDFPLHTRNTRDLLGVLAPLKLIQSFLFRNGSREFLLQKM